MVDGLQVEGEGVGGGVQALGSSLYASLHGKTSPQQCQWTGTSKTGLHSWVLA